MPTIKYPFIWMKRLTCSRAAGKLRPSIETG